jgi:hypothetical protein
MDEPSQMDAMQARGDIKANLVPYSRVAGFMIIALQERSECTESLIHAKNWQTEAKVRGRIVVAPGYQVYNIPV